MAVYEQRALIKILVIKSGMKVFIIILSMNNGKIYATGIDADPANIIIIKGVQTSMIYLWGNNKIAISAFIGGFFCIVRLDALVQSFACYVFVQLESDQKEADTGYCGKDIQ